MSCGSSRLEPVRKHLERKDVKGQRNFEESVHDAPCDLTLLLY